MLVMFAHAGESHLTQTEALSHNVLGTWYVALPLFVVLLMLIAVLTYLFTNRSKSVTANVLMALLLVVGVGMYNTSAVVSVLALTAGFGLTLFQVMVGLGRPEPSKKRHSSK